MEDKGGEGRASGAIRGAGRRPRGAAGAHLTAALCPALVPRPSSTNPSLPILPTGVGKTLVAKAIAGQAAVPFYQMAGSEFVEAIVGVSACTGAGLA